jgi:glycosyltransferase involved in cell wall biosynthesis
VSSTTPRLTVLIPCKNEQENIRPCIESVRAAAHEILVADSGSTDGTLAIVRSMGGCRVIRREYVSYGDFLNWAVPQAENPWVLVVDADERATESLAAEIRGVLRAGPGEDGYWIRRANHFLGRRVRFSGWQTDRVLRLFRRDLAHYPAPGYHGRPAIASGHVGRLRGRLLHYPYRSYDEYFRKFHVYTLRQAKRWHEAGKRASLWGLLLSGPSRFLRDYVVRLGVLDGRAGLQVCALAGFYSFMKRARLWELRHGRQEPDPEAQGVPPHDSQGAPTAACDPQRASTSPPNPQPASPSAPDPQLPRPPLTAAPASVLPGATHDAPPRATARS